MTGEERLINDTPATNLFLVKGQNDIFSVL